MCGDRVSRIGPEEEAVVSKRIQDKVVAELNAKIVKMSEDRRKQVVVLQDKMRVKVGAEKQKVFCPTCEKRLKYDPVEEEHVCPRDGWRGQRGDAILED